MLYQEEVISSKQTVKHHRIARKSYFFIQILLFSGSYREFAGTNSILYIITYFQFSRVLVHQIKNRDRTHLNLKTSPSIAYP